MVVKVFGGEGLYGLFVVMFFEEFRNCGWLKVAPAFAVVAWYEKGDGGGIAGLEGDIRCVIGQVESILLKLEECGCFVLFSWEAFVCCKYGDLLQVVFVGLFG